MRVALTGASGLLGTALTRVLRARGDEVVALARTGTLDAPAWSGPAGEPLPEFFGEVDAVVHLAGHNIAARRWNEAHKRAVLQSRVEGTRAIVRALEAAPKLPSTCLCASAIGIFGSRGDEKIDEQSAPGEGFLAEVTKAWEEAAAPLAKLDIRHVTSRFGIVLSKEGGPLGPMLLPYRFFVGGPMGPGSQWMAWIHHADVTGALMHLLDNERSSGAYNLTAPNPMTNRDFSRALGKAMGRPSWAPAPAFALRLALGREMADELLLVSQRIHPGRLLDEGYAFRHPTLDTALTDLFG